MRDSVTPKTRLVLALSLGFAMILPSIVTWLYFIVLARDNDTQNLAQQLAYGTGKLIQALFPLLVVCWLEGRFPCPKRPAFKDIVPGMLFGLLVAAGMFGLYYAWLTDSPVLGSAPRRIQEKVTQLGLDTPARYCLLSVGYTIGHSLFEEYYFRWFVFGYLRKLAPFSAAVLVSSLAFMAHHVILLYVFLPHDFFRAVVPLSLCIAVGGACWAYFYERTGSIFAAWVSHGIVDAAIFALGWILLQRAAA